MLSFQDIPQFPKAAYEVDVSWNYIEQQIEGFTKDFGLDLNPDFQRAHVWTEDQQRAYIEYIMQGGEVGKNITFNCPGWRSMAKNGRMEIVDGKQRLEAVRKFLRNDLHVFGYKYLEFTGKLRITTHGFKWRVCELNKRSDLLRLYLNINAGGTPHTDRELARVRRLLEQAQEKEFHT